MFKKLLITLCLSLLWVANINSQSTWWVISGGAGAADGTSQSDASADLNGIIQGATAGDTINIVGTYTQTTVIGVATSLNFVGISSGTLDGTSGSAGLFSLNSAVNYSFTDLTFQNYTKSTPGTVIQTATNAQVTITNCTFDNNTNSTNKGGAINSFAGDFTITGTTFNSNSAAGNTGGGAINMSGASDFTISNCTFTSNSTSGTQNGGAITFLSSGTLNINGSLFDGNSSTSNGGAFYSNQGSVSISTTTFVNNSATTSGGALTLSGTANSSLTNVSIYNNSTANTFNSWGGAIRMEGEKTVTITNSVIYGNTSDSGGTPIASDLGAGAVPNIALVNSLIGVANAFDTGDDDTNTNSTVGATLTLSFVSPNVTFSAPSSINDDTPIDFGNDGEDAGAWNSNINLFKGTTDSDWATAGNWSGTVPTATDNATLLSDSPDVVVSSSTGAVCNDLSVDAGSSLTINAGGSLIVSGSSTGNVIYNRTLNFVSGNDKGWHLVTSPVAGEVFDNTWATGGTNSIATGNSNNVGVATYDASGNAWTYLQSTGSPSSISSTSGHGYSMKRSATGTVAFTGTINTADVNSVSVSIADDGYNLLGSPYTSYMSSETFLDANTNLDAQIWTFTEGGGYTARTKVSNFILAPGQGFFVKAASGTTVDFAETNQSSGTDNFQKTATTQVKLLISDAVTSRFVEMNYYDNNVSTGHDRGYEGKTFKAQSNVIEVFTHLLSDSKGENYQVQALPKNDMESIVIPVGVKALANKEITFSVNASNLPSGLKVFLEDRVTKTFTRLDEVNSSYKITLSEDMNGIGRFYLHTKSSVLSTTDLSLDTVSIYKTSSSNLRIAGLSQGKASLKLFNILGKQVMNTSFTSKNGVNDISLPSLATGIYIVQLEIEKGMLNKKITLE